MDEIIAEFELQYTGWGWLVRSFNGGYFAHLTHPKWDGQNEFPHFKGYGVSPLIAFEEAYAELEDSQ